MKDKNWFIDTKNSNFTDSDLTQILIAVRDGLTHQISLPIGVILVKDLFVAKSNIKGYDFIIAVNELILSVRNTVAETVSDQNNSTCYIDGKFTKIYFQRSVAGQVIINLPDGTITSGSAP